MTQSLARPTIITALFAEWEYLSRQRQNIKRANAWDLPGQPVEHLDDILRRAGFGIPTNDDEFDSYLSQLVVVAASDDLASRIVLQRILPGLVSIAVRRAPIIAQGLPGAFDLVTSAAWIVIRQFPIDRRARRVAANLLMDIEYAAFVRDGRLKSTRSEDHFSPEGLLGIEFGRVQAGNVERDPVAEAGSLELLLHGLVTQGLSAKDIQMLRAVSQDVNSVQAAEVLGLSPRSVRNRRERALSRAHALLNAEQSANDDISKT
jgi:DNA-binding CsgD family transcriptional regulator